MPERKVTRVKRERLFGVEAYFYPKEIALRLADPKPDTRLSRREAVALINALQAEVARLDRGQ